MKPMKSVLFALIINIIVKNASAEGNGKNIDIEELAKRVLGLEHDNTILKQQVANLAEKDEKLNNEMELLRTENVILKNQCEIVKKDVFDKVQSLEKDVEILKFAQMPYTTDDKNGEYVNGTENMTSPAAMNGNTGRHIRQLSQRQVAFYATITVHDIQHVGSNQAIKFDSILTNVGTAYNQHSGYFTAPVPGIYVIHTTIAGWGAQSSDKHNYLDICVNSVKQAALYGVPFQQESQTLIVYLNAGDVVSVKNAIVDEAILGSHYSSFAGFLLYETETEPSLGK
ncbi:complement C1q tumor necrosis factor-related protein 8-like [Mya arenaria]|uniref:complement C1q tumor necrosis factor-related protein 8-like n=1 Tax=Mya arenaria TaxID=6604 RepID=UPI0022E7CD74|nr:complement C1q tumor necrosis factor-related protein 8-like [Mya arenaria]